ncbi:MAG: dihydroorotate dehydrogenase [Muribaculaceae bacterium]|nr:dihydroorotate dehydrogenase [Muribaculaceae bacterium]
MEVNDIDLSVNLCGVTLQNPVIPASGCFGFGYEMNQFYPVDILGSISLKGTTLSPRFGNPLPRVAECNSGLINSVGLQNPGIDAVIAKELPRLREIFHQPIIANISGFSIDEYLECCSKITKQPQVEFIELNVSCPNVHGGGMSFGTDPEVLGQLVKEVKKVCTLPLIVKLTPNVTDIVKMAKSCVDNGADGLCLINTLLGMRIDIKTRKPVIANVMGGFSGPAIFPVALRMVYQVRQAFPNLPIIGCGGVSSASDVVEMIMAGANAVEIGSANLRNPYACEEIVYELPSLLRKLNVTSIKELVS